MKDKNDPPQFRFVPYLPELITDKAECDHTKKRIKIRITMTERGIEIIGDSMYPTLLDDLLKGMSAEEIERMLCG